ncbi:hypothetical protein D3C75_1191390 [compost metagenome]
MPGEQQLLQQQAGDIVIPFVDAVDQGIAILAQGQLNSNISGLHIHGISFPFRSSSCSARSLLCRAVKASRNSVHRSSRFIFLYSLARRFNSFTAAL